MDYFTPHDQAMLSDIDADLGSTGTTLLPDSAGAIIAPGVRQQLLVGSGKLGRVYLLDRNNLGKFDPATDHVVQQVVTPLVGVFGTGGYFVGTAAYFLGTLYYVDGHTHTAMAFPLVESRISPRPTSQSAATYNIFGASPTISANQSANAIVWTLDRHTNELHAYDAANLGHELYNTDQAPGYRDWLGSVVKFTVPTVANGHVYVGTSNALIGYGLLSPTPPAPPASPPTPAEVRVAMVTRLYHDILGQAPGPQQLNAGTQVLARGRSIQPLAARLWFSPRHRKMAQSGIDPGMAFPSVLAHTQLLAQSLRLHAFSTSRFPRLRP